MLEDEDQSGHQPHYNSRQRKFSLLNIFASTQNISSPGTNGHGKKGAVANVVNIPGVIRQGFLVKQGQNYKNLKKRYFILLDDCLLYFKDGSDIFHPLGVIYLYEAFVDDEPFDEKRNYHSFVVRSFSKRFLLNCTSEEDKQKWVQSIQKVIHNHSSLRRVSSSSSIEEFHGKSSAPETIPSRNQAPNLHLPSNSFDPSTLLEKIQKEQDKVLKIISSISILDKPLEDLQSFTQKQKLFVKNFEKKHSITLNEEVETHEESGEDSGDEFAAVKRIGDTASVPQFTRRLSSPHFLDPIEKLNSFQNYMTEVLEDLETVFKKVTKYLENNQQIVSKFSTSQGLFSIIRELKQNQQILKKAVLHQLQSFETEFSTFNKTMNIQESFRFTDTQEEEASVPIATTPSQAIVPIVNKPVDGHSDFRRSINFQDNRKSIDIASSSALLEFQKVLKENESLKLERERMDAEIKELKRVRKLLVKEIKQFRSEAS